ncbi:MAG: hypothetical protein ABW022_14930 [Actinoplanes sp.]
MSAQQVLDTVERLFAAAGHPDIEGVERYGRDPQAVMVVYRSRAKAFLWPVLEKASTRPAELPTDLGEYKFRTLHALRMLVDLLEIAQPDGWQWRPVAVDDATAASGIEVKAGGQVTLLRVTSGSPMGPDADPADWADWTYPSQAQLNG